MTYSLGIDLGTTNSALSFAPLDGSGAASALFPIVQRDSAAATTEHSTLPSFLLRAGAGEPDSLDGWIAGRYARKMAADRPGAVVHSAKSWLCHHAVDRSQPILPWGSQELPATEKLSPIQASALLLRHLREAWNAQHAAAGAPFDQQAITLTVPASFDAAAQKLTLEAAGLAGFPPTVRLLEEPQAAFYRWLEAHPGHDALRETLPALATAPQHVLVIDIGGGTSDFSLFEITTAEPGKRPAIKRVAVSDHILLGGDNVDLALAHLLEPRLGGSGSGAGAGTLTAGQWSYLVARCRDLKERVLSEDLNAGEGETAYALSVPSAGSGLMAGSLSAEIRPAEILQLLLEGFFPACKADSRPARSSTGLRELGLPYATDSAITRHLAAFLAGRPRVDAILCNGGTLTPERLRRHVGELVGAWQDGAVPTVLENPEPDLAVARGAAHYGVLCHQPEQNRIQAGAARAVYLEVGAARAGAPARTLVCILPRGAEPEEVHHVAKPALRLRVDTRVEFQPWYSTRRSRDKAGTVVALDESAFHPLPPLRTTARLPAGTPAPAGGRIPVHLHTSLNAVGVLQVECVPADGPPDLRWPLEFNLQAVQQHADAEVRRERQEKKGGLLKFVKIRLGGGGKAPSVVQAVTKRAPLPIPAPVPVVEEPSADLGLDPTVLDEARAHLATVLQNPGDRRNPVSSARLLKSLQQLLGAPKQDWSGALVRGLWPAVEASFSARTLSMDHEAAWMGLAGFLLRPGYGAPGDAARLDALWHLHEDGLAFPKKGQKIQSHVLWRRVAGGLDSSRQSALLDAHWSELRGANPPPAELVLLAGALERLDFAAKHELVALFLPRAVALVRENGHAGPWLMALTSLLSRIPLYAGPEQVLPPESVADAFEATRALDWSSDSALGLHALFLRAARLTGDRQLDLPRPLSKEITSKLSQAGVDPGKLAPLKEVVPLAATDRAHLFGESLPVGISLG